MIGRNDPCPCGSGKKYKKCCLAKDRAAQAQNQEEQAAKPKPDALDPYTSIANKEVVLDREDANSVELEPDIDPLIKRMNDFLEGFLDAPYQQMWEATADILTNEPELCDNEILFEIANTLFPLAVEAGEMVRFNHLLDQLEEAISCDYTGEKPYLSEWRILIALMTEDEKSAETCFYELSPLAGEDLDTYFRIVSALSYYGKITLLRNGMRQARPYVAKAGDVLSWAGEEFVTQLGVFEILYQSDHNPNLMSDDHELAQRFAEYKLTLNIDGLGTELDDRLGRTEPSWVLADFQPIIANMNESEIAPISRLLSCFTYYARQQGVPSSKAEMACKKLARYFEQRQEGELSGQKKMFGRSRKHKKKQRGRNNKHPQQHPLCPDALTLDRYLAQQLGFLSTQKYEAFALFELIPIWLQFLIQYDLLDEAQRQTTLQELNRLKASLIQLAENSQSDLKLKENLLDWPANVYPMENF